MSDPADILPSHAAAQPPAASICVCSRCGRPEAFTFGEESICEACYVECGSCCAGDDD